MDRAKIFVEPKLRGSLGAIPVTQGLTENSFELLEPGLIFDLQEALDAVHRRKDLRLATAADLPAFIDFWRPCHKVVALDVAHDGYAPGLTANGHGSALVRFNTRGVAFDETKVLCVKI